MRCQALSHWIRRISFVVVSVGYVPEILGLVHVHVLGRVELVGLKVELVLASFGRVHDVADGRLVLHHLAVAALHHEVVVS